MTQDEKALALQIYKNAIAELYRADEVFTKLCKETFGKYAGTYRHIPEYYTPEIKAAAEAYRVASKAFFEASETYHKLNK